MACGTDAPPSTPTQTPTMEMTPPPATPEPTPTPEPSPTPEPTPEGSSSEAEAAALVLASDERFAGIGPRDLQASPGGGSHYTVAEEDHGWTVSIELGWGDCPAGCIYSQTQIFSVGRDGAIQLVEQSGDSLDAGAGYQPPAAAGEASISVWLQGGSCTFEVARQDAGCLQTPVPHVTVILRDESGEPLDEEESSLGGRVEFTDLAAGVYIVEPGERAGLIAPEAAAVFAVAEHPVDLFYESDEALAPPIMVSVTDDLVMRSSPSVGQESVIYDIRLQPGDELRVLDGPREGSGYEWYYGEVDDPSAPGGTRTGWVAAASREGEPWLAAADDS